MASYTAYEILDKIAQIADDKQRAEELRKVLVNNNPLAIIIQRTYHPNYNFDLPKGPLDEKIAKKSNHHEAGPMLTSIRKWEIFRPASEVPFNANIKPHVREGQFIALYEGVASDDADLLIGVKDKKLPWDSLNADFIVDNFPELFPDSFRPSDKVETVEEKSKSVSVPSVKPEERLGTAKDQCLWIMQNNPGLTRKEYIELFQAIGVKKSTGGLYYQQFKDKI